MSPKQMNAYFQTFRSALRPHSFDTPHVEVMAARPSLCTQHPSVKAIEALLGAWRFPTDLHLCFCARSVPAPILFIAHGDSNCHTWPGNFSSPSQHMKRVRVTCSKNIGVMRKNAYFQHVLFQIVLSWQAGTTSACFVFCEDWPILFMFFMKVAPV